MVPELMTTCGSSASLSASCIQALSSVCMNRHGTRLRSSLVGSGPLPTISKRSLQRGVPQESSHAAQDVTKTFCAKNGISMVVRSHQSKKDGIGSQVVGFIGSSARIRASDGLLGF